MPVETQSLPLSGKYVLADVPQTEQWSLGASVFQKVNSPTGGQSGYRILDYAIQVELHLDPIGQEYGKLGKLFGGFTRGQPQPAPFLPNDLTLVTEIWNGQQDEVPPKSAVSTSGDNPAAPIPSIFRSTVELPQPYEIPAQPNFDLYMSLWLTPSLVCAWPHAAIIYTAGQGPLLKITSASWSMTWEEV